MKKILLALMLFVAIPTFTVTKSIFDISVIESAYAVEVETLAAIEVTAVEDIEPQLEVVKSVLTFLVTAFPKAGPIIQGTVEVVGGLATLFTLLSVFLIGLLKIPVLVARFSGANELADKIQKLSDKISPYFKYLSIFNVQKKK